MSVNSFVLNLFLYFPENKLDYIPAVIELIFAVGLCFLVFNLIRRSAKKQHAKALELEKKVLERNKQDLQRH